MVQVMAWCHPAKKAITWAHVDPAVSRYMAKYITDM